jgi:hypothetical protein
MIPIIIAADCTAIVRAMQAMHGGDVVVIVADRTQPLPNLADLVAQLHACKDLPTPVEPMPCFATLRGSVLPVMRGPASHLRKERDYG